MKRKSSGGPTFMVYRTVKPPPSCRPCRQKKRRCDRKQPCSNCFQRDIECEYEGREQRRVDDEEHPPADQPESSHESSRGHSTPSTVQSSAPLEKDPTASSELLNRINRLENAVFSNLDNASSSNPTSAEQHVPSQGIPVSHHGSHRLPEQISRRGPIDIALLIAELPPIAQARKLFEHFVTALHPSLCILHIPSVRDMMEETYREIHVQGNEAPVDKLFLLFSIFAGATSSWTCQLLEMIHASRVVVQEACEHYVLLAMSILDDTHRPVPSTTSTICGIATLAHVVLNSDNPSHNRALILRARFLVMSRNMQLHKLDTFRSREERRIKGADAVDVEVRRRVWWHMVATDWLGSFSGGSKDGVYTFNKRQMNVRYPANVDDEFVTSSGPSPDLPLSTTTSMTYFLLRVHTADICREIVDTIPPIIDEFPEPNYEIIMNFDRRFQNLLRELPEGYRLDHTSVQNTRHVCQERPYIAWQHIATQFSLHARICRLHRPYHLEISASPTFTYSRDASVRSAHKMLELRRMMDHESVVSDFKPGRSWVILQHTTSAALTLATDVSNNPGAPDAETRRQKALAAYRVLESSKTESRSLIKGIEKSLRAIMASINTVPTQVSFTTPASTSKEAISPHNSSLDVFSAGEPSFRDTGEAMPGGATHTGGIEGEIAHSSQLWTEFLATVPDLQVPQWNSLLDDIDFDFDLNWGSGAI